MSYDCLALSILEQAKKDKAQIYRDLVRAKEIWWDYHDIACWIGNYISEESDEVEIAGVGKGVFMAKEKFNQLGKELSGDNFGVEQTVTMKGLPCPFTKYPKAPRLCQEGWCGNCFLYQSYRRVK